MMMCSTNVMKNGMKFVDGRQVLKDGALLGVGGIVGAARVNNVVYYRTNIYICRNSLAMPGLPQRRPGDQFEQGVMAGQAQGGTGFQGWAQGVAAQVHH